ncbi:hypothetical protein [Pseudoxanthomonas sp. GM95]|uniref:hypothetical protein n=1 Tax=Pseudoxanthomonas sp. GM95 TaxID=1881043 RepID=UPI001113609E|nr:hypothetical protein [Pseudoxanthomonas sp. GM95]
MGLPLVISALSVGLAPLSHDAQPLVGGSAASTAAVTLASVAALTLLLWAALGFCLRRQSLQIDAQGLRVQSTFFSTQVAIAQLQLDQARVVDLEEHTELRPFLKTRGYGLPGFRSGWYRLRNKRKAFVATADSRFVLWLPSTAGHGLLLDVRDPNGLLRQLRELAAHTRPR